MLSAPSPPDIEDKRNPISAASWYSLASAIFKLVSDVPPYPLTVATITNWNVRIVSSLTVIMA